MESKKRPYETKTASISIHFEEIQAARGGGIYKEGGDIKIINVNSTTNAEFDEVFKKVIPNFVILQSPNGYTMVQVHKVKNEKTPHNTAASPFRPRRKKLQKSGKKVSKKSGKVRKNKKSKKSRN